MPDDKRPRDLLDWMGVTDAPRWRVARPLGPLVAVVLSILLLLALIAAFAVLGHTMQLASSGASEGINLGAGALIVALLGAPFLIWSTVLKHQTVRYQKEGHMTDRINKAVEQLGAEKTVKVRGTDAEGKAITFEETRPNIEVRIGAILSLERIAQDSTRNDKGRDHVRVMEILCAYIRENAPAHEAGKDNPRDLWEAALNKAKEELAPQSFASDAKRAFQESELAFEICGLNPTNPDLSDQVNAWVNELLAPRADIAVALQVIGRRDAEQRRVEARWGKDAAPDAEWVFDNVCPALPARRQNEGLADEDLKQFESESKKWQSEVDSYRGYRLDLRNLNLQRVDLSGLCLSGARLEATHMEGANLTHARLVGADLRKARMEAANLWKASCEGADFRNARMEGAILSLTKLQKANLSVTRLEGADFGAARMDGAYLWQANLEKANFQRTRLDYTILSSARLARADLRGAKLTGALLDVAALSQARVDHDTDWDVTNIFGAAVSHIDFTYTPISADLINLTFGDASTILPAHIPRPAHWPKHVLHPSEFDAELAKWRADPDGYRPPE